MKKWLFAAAYVSLLCIAFIYRYDWLAWADKQTSFPALLLISFLFALIPFVPYKLIIASIAYAVGAWQGALICWLGTTLAALVVYGAVRTLLRDKGREYLERVPALERLNQVMERKPFTAVLLARLIPVIPQAAVNVYAGVAGFPFWSFLLGTAIGKLPAIAVYAYAGSAIAEHPITGLVILLLYTVLLGGFFVLYRKRLQRASKT
ncbi:TVP38/TMEM64 family protein [Paenibacillus brasilensis]|uniref:TVP38/TMEM64 family membrane protein n=1 Tax=Paenibacillus brasilensis TaxID=128574 RepID=A0ABU0KRU4_9BACL|nr:TVP38/TMEM64 family protein [Paenibacillus brasilensis]MDQ0492157.1 putative membrane protein YdjX (TVP38/TMEM64 family) [Paenibacillus brasilensis]